jgi:hypothetical protein
LRLVAGGATNYLPTSGHLEITKCFGYAATPGTLGV